ncbi:MAG TPA: copper amine oxidase N-terminal domain-containing protein [Clostridia bacterium]|nr:copper amine oxidase N-terminal domain-containing protein [Clostridia bacterium]
MKKWSIFLVMASVLLFVAVGIASAGDPVRIYVNDKELDLDVPARIIGGRTVAPIRWVAEALGADVRWDERSRTVYITCAEVPDALLRRLRTLEPEDPKRVEGDWISEMVDRFVGENGLSSVKEIKARGLKVPFEVTSGDEDWVRPAYSRHWHSTFMGGKFSDVTRLLAYARRNVFVYSGGLSEGSGLYYCLGFDEDWDKPVGSSFSPKEAFELWLVSCRVLEVRRLGSEWLVVVEPALKGYQTVRVKYSDAGIEVDEREGARLMLFRIVTPDGYELERTAAYLPAV